MKEKTKKRKQCERNEEATEDSFSSHGAQSSDHKRPKGHPGSKSWGGAIKSSFLSHFEKVKGKGSKTTDPATEKSERKGQPNHQESKSAPAPSGNRAVGLHKNRRDGEARGHENTTGGEHAAKSIHNHPFPTEYGDHFETSKVAIHDISPLLEQFAKLCGKQKSSLAVYDPYYCDGASSSSWLLHHMDICCRCCDRAFSSGGICNTALTGVEEHASLEQIRHCGDKSSLLGRSQTEVPRALRSTSICSCDLEMLTVFGTVSKEKAWMVLLPAYCATKNYFTELMSNWRERGKVFFAVPKVHALGCRTKPSLLTATFSRLGTILSIQRARGMP
eukprot:766272-Hanusia_phi.AAC.4